MSKKLERVTAPVRAGVIGLGKGLDHARGYRRSPRATLMALCDVDAQRLAAAAVDLEPERTFTDPQQMFASGELDVVSVATPNASHHELVLAALDAGLHVLCEKPLALSAQQAQEMTDAAHSAGRNLMVGYTFRFVPASLALKASVDAGALGQVYFGRSVWHRSRGIPGLRRDAPKTWFVDKHLAGGGPLIDLGVHRLDLALWLMGFPEVTSVTGATYRHLGVPLAARMGHDYDVEDLAVAFLRLAGGATLQIEASWALNRSERELMETRLYGTTGGLLQRNVGEGYEFEAELYGDGADGAFHATRLTPGPEHRGTVYDEFIDAVIGGRPSSAPGEHGVAVLRVLDAIYASAAEGREVTL